MEAKYPFRLPLGRASAMRPARRRSLGTTPVQSPCHYRSGAEIKLFYLRNFSLRAPFYGAAANKFLIFKLIEETEIDL